MQPACFCFFLVEGYEYPGALLTALANDSGNAANTIVWEKVIPAPARTAFISLCTAEASSGRLFSKNAEMCPSPSTQYSATAPAPSSSSPPSTAPYHHLHHARGSFCNACFRNCPPSIVVEHKIDSTNLNKSKSCRKNRTDQKKRLSLFSFISACTVPVHSHVCFPTISSSLIQRACASCSFSLFALDCECL